MELVAVFGPLFGAVVAGLFGRVLGHRACEMFTCALMILAAGASIYLFKDVAFDGNARVLHLFTWIATGTLDVGWALRFDQLTAVMVFVVNVVSACVHIYSVGYMHHDPARGRFMAYLSLFTFTMLMLVTADNFLQLFFGWEGVGLASYLLIGFWNQRDSANRAAIKAFVMNRVGDFGLILGILTVFVIFGSLDFQTVFTAAADKTDVVFTFLGYSFNAISLACFLLFIGAMGKSAQLGLHPWLPDAMEGPTPVSALIHAATMVTAGVFLVARCSPLFEYAPGVMQFVALIGALTALVAATIAITQFDIKRVIAYSTMSQLGYMFFALGVSAYSAAMFHLFTHAFFKALLFLGAGSVIHAMSDEQDMRRMGGVWKMIPVTYAFMWIGNLALAGLPWFAGYYSKDLILEAAYADHTGIGMFAFWCGIAAALLTAFYSWRLLFMTFHSTPRADEKTMAHVHESPLIMTLPLGILAIGALFAGFAFYGHFVGDNREAFWAASIFSLDLANNGEDVISHAHHVPAWVKLLPIFVALAGIAVAALFYLKATDLPGKIAATFAPVHRFLFNKWYFDELYAAVIIRPAMVLAHVFWRSDKTVIDGLGPDGVSSVVKDGAGILSRLQTGYVYHYAFSMLVGVSLLLGWLFYHFCDGACAGMTNAFFGG